MMVASSDAILDPQLTSRRGPAFRQVPGAFVAPERAGGSVSEFMRKAGFDYDITEAPIAYRSGTDAAGRPEYSPVQGQKILLAPDPAHPGVQRELGVVGAHYPLLQNRDIAAMLDPFTAQWTVDTVGEYGDLFYVALDAGEVALFPELERETYRLYFTVMEWRAKGRALSIMATPVRLWCGNQNRIASKSAVLAIKIPHTGGDNFRQDAEWYSAMIARGLDASEAAFDDLRRLRDIELTAEDVQAVARSIYADPSLPRDARLARDFARAGRGLPDGLDERARAARQRWEASREAVVERRAGLVDLYDLFSQENADLSGTGYALYQAAVEHLDYAGGRNARESAAFGRRADLKLTAYRAIADIGTN